MVTTSVEDCLWLLSHSTQALLKAATWSGLPDIEVQDLMFVKCRGSHPSQLLPHSMLASYA